MMAALAVSTVLLPGCGGNSGQSNGTAQTNNIVNGHLIGMWGAKDLNEGLQLTPTGGQLTLYCGWGGPLSQPVTLDAGSHFDVPGMYSSNVPNLPVRYVGTVTGNILVLTVIATDSVPNVTVANYTLILGQMPPSTSPYNGGCPG
jgi:hypothetical protein